MHIYIYIYIYVNYIYLSISLSLSLSIYIYIYDSYVIAEPGVLLEGGHGSLSLQQLGRGDDTVGIIIVVVVVIILIHLCLNYTNVIELLCLD